MYYASSIFAIFKSLLSVHELFWLEKKKGQTTIRRATDNPPEFPFAKRY
jgi:hypothetical protein